MSLITMLLVAGSLWVTECSLYVSVVSPGDVDTSAVRVVVLEKTPSYQYWPLWQSKYAACWSFSAEVQIEIEMMYQRWAEEQWYKYVDRSGLVEIPRLPEQGTFDVTTPIVTSVGYIDYGWREFPIPEWILERWYRGTI